jgi:hypothetical protein
MATGCVAGLALCNLYAVIAPPPMAAITTTISRIQPGVLEGRRGGNVEKLLMSCGDSNRITFHHVA